MLEEFSRSEIGRRMTGSTANLILTALYHLELPGILDESGSGAEGGPEILTRAAYDR